MTSIEADVTVLQTLVEVAPTCKRVALPAEGAA